ncbi:MAG: prephenate dehydratase [Candidatus Methanomethyliales bacterium]|nr:prephenate dehydratase [Candidatus Methanomethylicales archaeon]
MGLREVRKKIEEIDREIVRLIDERIKLCKEIAIIKSEADMPVFDPGREREVVESAHAAAALAPAKGVERVFREIISMCRNAQRSLSVAYLGPEGSFSHEAATILGSSNRYAPCRRIMEIFRSVDNEEADLGVVPLENSIEGSVNETLDCLMEYPLYIVGEVLLRINQNLMVNPRISSLCDVERLYSHPQALAQCEGYISRYLSNAEVVVTESTARAAELVSRDTKGAAIGSKTAAELNGLRIMAMNIEDSPKNYTRFAILSRERSKAEGEKTAVIFFLDNVPGALSRVLSDFAEAGINITMILSRPIMGRPWEYFFYMEFEGGIGGESRLRVIENARRKSKSLKVLGSYSRLA